MRSTTLVTTDLRAFVESYWHRWGDHPNRSAVGAPRVSWAGFYQKDVASDTMSLVCREPKPACSPIGLFGMCGRGWREQKNFIVRDVRVLGENYVACDPRDQSELVIPIYESEAHRARGECWGVFDVDSYDLHAFEVSHARAVLEMLHDAHITTPIDSSVIVL